MQRNLDAAQRNPGCNIASAPTDYGSRHPGCALISNLILVVRASALDKGTSSISSMLVTSMPDSSRLYPFIPIIRQKVSIWRISLE